MGKILVPASSPEDWKRLLAEPEKHWKRGYSARALAFCWQAAGDIPGEVREVLAQSVDLKGIESIFCIPEHQVPLPGGSRPSQSDIWVLGKTHCGLVSIAVEGKVSESFGPTIGDWYADASLGKEKRLRFLCSELELLFPPDESLRYQLFHRTASAIIEAKRFHASDAVMLVHSFISTDEWFSDYQKFLDQFGLCSAVNQIVTTQMSGSMRLHFGWVHGSSEWLAA